MRSVAGSTSCCLSRQLQLCLPCSTIHHLTGSASRLLAVSPLCPACPSPPLLPVWINVSSLSPWLLDFHTVRFSVSSRCLLFLNCCCPFGCAKRHSVSTYASILARSPGYAFSYLFKWKQVVLTEGGSIPSQDCPRSPMARGEGHVGWYSVASPALQPGLVGPVWGRQGRDRAWGGPDTGVWVSSP